MAAKKFGCEPFRPHSIQFHLVWLAVLSLTTQICWFMQRTNLELVGCSNQQLMVVASASVSIILPKISSHSRKPIHKPMMTRCQLMRLKVSIRQ